MQGIWVGGCAQRGCALPRSTSWWQRQACLTVCPGEAVKLTGLVVTGEPGNMSLLSGISHGSDNRVPKQFSAQFSQHVGILWKRVRAEALWSRGEGKAPEHSFPCRQPPLHLLRAGRWQRKGFWVLFLFVEAPLLVNSTQAQ